MYNNEMNFWQQLPTSLTALAPMEGVTDIVFRQVVLKAARPDVFFTEFTNVSSYASEKGRPNALQRLEFLPAEQPIVAQIWGTNPEHFATTARGLVELGYKAVDINMGCPEKHVVATGGGSGLIRTPDLALQIIAATKTASLPTSVKTRLGYSQISEWPDWLSTLLGQNLDALTIHLRTKKEMSKVPAHHELIPGIITLRDQISPATRLIFNGDFTSRAHFDQILASQNIQKPATIGCMIGRGIFANPFCFEKTPKTHNREQLITLLRYHLDLFDKETIQPFEPLKRFFKIYINNFPGASDIRVKLMDCKTTNEVRSILDSI